MKEKPKGFSFFEEPVSSFIMIVTLNDDPLIYIKEIRNMKKVIYILLILLCACACTRTEEYDAEAIINHHNKNETIGVPFRTEVEWIVEPSMVMESVKMLKAEAPLGYPVLEHTGHPQEWDYMAGKGPFLIDKAEYIGAPVYTANAIAGADGNIYDYDGNLLNEGYDVHYGMGSGFEKRYLDHNMSEIYSGDFIGTVERNILSDLSGGDLGLFEYKGVLYSTLMDYHDIDRNILTYGYELLFNGEVDIEKDLEYRKATADDLFGHRAAVPVFDGKILAGEVYDMAIYDGKGNRLSVFDNTEESEEIDFTNGFLMVENRARDGVALTIRYAFYSIDEQRYITDFDYEEVLPFVEGYAAVRKDGKWAYIDEKGELVTDFIWDDVSTMYEGKVYVGLKDRFGILDLKNTLAKGTKVTMETCYGSSDPQMAYAAISALAEHVPKQMERDSEAVAAEEETEKAHKIIGVITPRFDDINVREKPSTSAKVVDVLKNEGSEGNEFYFMQFVYEVTEAEDYTWYRIGTDRWVADHGNWYEVELFGE